MGPSALEEIAEVAAAFAAEAAIELQQHLGGEVERLIVRRADWFSLLKPDTAAAFRIAASDAVRHATELLGARLREPGLWLEPTVTHDRGPDRDLRNPNHRVWVALLAAGKPLDPVLAEFGLEPSDAPDLGGGHFGIRALDGFDRRGKLTELWHRYLKALERHRQGAG